MPFLYSVAIKSSELSFQSVEFWARYSIQFAGMLERSTVETLIWGTNGHSKVSVLEVTIDSLECLVIKLGPKSECLVNFWIEIVWYQKLVSMFV